MTSEDVIIMYVTAVVRILFHFFMHTGTEVIKGCNSVKSYIVGMIITFLYAHLCNYNDAWI